MTDLMPEQLVDLDEVGGVSAPSASDGLDAVDEQLIARLAGMIDDPLAGKLLALGHPPPHVGLHGPLRPVARRPPHVPPRPRPTSVVLDPRVSVPRGRPSRFPGRKPPGDGNPRVGQAGVTVTGMPVMWAWLDSGSKLPALGPAG